MPSRHRFLAALPLLAASLPALAQSEPLPLPPADDAPPADSLLESKSPWRFDMYAWIWAIGVEANAAAGDASADVSANVFDIIDASDSLFALSGRLELGYGPVGFYFEGLYIDLGADDQTGPMGATGIDVTVQQVLLDAGLSYRFIDERPKGNASGNRHNFSFDLYAGARYLDLDLTIAPPSSPSSSASRDWVDPILGAKFIIPFAHRWHAEVNADIGGFGANSDFAWSATGVLAYDFDLFNCPSSFLFGYRAFGWEYSDGSGPERFTWDMIQHGVLLGFKLSF